MPLAAAVCEVLAEYLIYNQMVVDTLDKQEVDRVFQALADATRRDIVRRAMDGDHSVSALARSYAMSFAAVQKHIAVLERAGLVTKERRGREKLVRTNIDTIRTAYNLLEQLEEVWRSRIEGMDAILDEPEEGES